MEFAHEIRICMRILAGSITSLVCTMQQNFWVVMVGVHGPNGYVVMLGLKSISPRLAWWVHDHSWMWWCECVCCCLCMCVCLSVYKDLRGDPRLMSLIIDDELRMENINRLWDNFNRALNDKNACINDRLTRFNCFVYFFFVSAHSKWSYKRW